MNMTWCSARIFVPITLLGIAGFASTRPTKPLMGSQREAIQARVSTNFDYTVLFKPAEAGTSGTGDLKFAPLIIQEVADTNLATIWRDQFDVADSRSLVISETGTNLVNGRPHDQFAYVWSYSSSTLPGQSVRKSQGVRLTLNAAGEPVIWEVLEDSSGAEILYVSQSLELAARAEFGPPLPGRKFSIERSLKDAPQTVVASVIDDGPVPMGPVVYLQQGTGNVTTIICRCMASQGGTLLGQTNYDLHPAVPPNVRPSSFPKGNFEASLRLPSSF
jgi:hypothetical protein